jgi:flagellar basal-body rod modification protein FlgD
MNALLAVRSNAAGLANPTPAERAEAQEKLQANAKAFSMGKVLKAEVIAKAAQLKNALGEQELGRDAFLTLLINQIQHQDPLEPVENSQMIAQLAQFSALEQTANMATALENLTGNIDQLNFINASNLLGREIVGLDTEGALIQGEVQHVQLNGSVVMLTVNDRLVSMAGVQSIR